ncbi:sensor histidine kinase [Paenibacillus marchantiophytorum]|uniref:histidine kinase n=1 Tax=Paenibacillus marchantiophytorum TaxID=1619310 RepID=A0ABQ1F8X3_9BACL|nr:sensor histidine kinase [Paenibacillus marchantiophytorum]GGA02149.1 sensor histidine kinase [Paenibacillus marchantiophytorum]
MKRLIAYFRNSTVRKKLIITYLVVTIVPILALGIYAYQSSKEYLKKQLMIGMTHTVSQTALNVDQKMEKAGDFISFMVFNPIVKKVAGSELPDFLSYTKELNDNIEPTIWYYININRELKDVLFYSDYTGKQIGNFIYPSDNVRHASWYEESRKANKTQWFYEPEQQLLFATHNIQKSDNITFAGVLYVKIDYDKMFEKLDQVYEGDYGILITDSKGQTVYAGERASTLSNLEIQTITGKAEGQFRMQGQEYMMTRSSLPSSGWTFTYFMPTASMIVDTKDILKATASVVLLCMVVLLFMIWLFSRTLVRPIHALKKKISIVENGDFDVPIVSTAKDEIGELTQSFAAMVKKVQDSIQDAVQARMLEKEAELSALQAQISPHFLYNTLSIMNWKAIQIDAMDISKVANSLSKFYRTSLNKGQQLTHIQDEITNIRAYLDIQLIMHDHEFDVVYDIEAGVYEFDTVNFILQPIVENAVIHGLDEKEDGRGVLHIEVREEADSIHFIVADNGKGMEAARQVDLLASDNGGYGLRNVQERIQLHYGSEFGIRIESEAGVGTKVHVVIPKV